MKSSNQNSNVKMPFTRRPQLILFILTACCVISMGYYYIKKENIVSVGQVAGAITVPVQKGVNKLGSIFFNFDQERLRRWQRLSRLKMKIKNSKSRWFLMIRRFRNIRI